MHFETAGDQTRWIKNSILEVQTNGDQNMDPNTGCSLQTEGFLQYILDLRGATVLVQYVLRRYILPSVVDQARKVRKPCFLLFRDFFSTSEREKQKNFEPNKFFLASRQLLTKEVGSGSVSWWYGSADPDPY
jgi:hypothetical protein